ncbi:MAG: Bcr/CflA family efflux MFS transporter [Alphaproteobacteria bacterium]|nr:Bcr/CflA family efflux MFS transporter [Alphaproteobacteria bacterium]
MHKNRLLIVLYVTGATVSGNFSTNLYVPSFPAMAEAFGASVGEVQATLAVFLATFGIAQLIVGPLSDRFGRRVVLLGGMAVFIAASIGCAWASHVSALIVWRIVQAIGACAGQVIARAIVRDLYEREEAARIMAYVGMATAISPATGPLLGGILQELFGWQASFYALALFGLALAAVTLFFMKETNPYLGLCNIKMFAGFAALARSAEYVGYVLTASFILAAIMAWNIGAPFMLIHRLGFTPADYGIFLAGLSVLAYFPGGYLSSRLSPRLGVDRTLALGSSICLAGALAFTYVVLIEPLSAGGVFVAMVVFSVGMALVFPNSTAGAIGAYPRIAGTASAGLGFSHMFLAGVATGTVSAFDDEAGLAYVIAFVGCSALSSASLLLLAGARRRSARNEPK